MADALITAFDALAHRVDGVLEIDGAAVTGIALDRLARAHARALVDLAPGTRVALAAPTSVGLVAALIAHLRLGLVHVPLNTRYQPSEVAHVLTDSGALDVGAPRIDGPPLEVWPERPDVLALLVYTSGTTGRAKGVMLSRRALAANLGAMMQLWGIGRGDVVGHALPLFHVHGLGLGLLGPLMVGARVRVRGKFDAAAMVAEVRAGVTVMMGVPTMYHALVEHLAGKPEDGVELARARLFTAGSAALPATLLERFRAATGHAILERYGMTETLFTLSNPLAGERRAGTVGLPVPGVEVRLVDDDGAIVDASNGVAAGEIEVRGAGLMDGYWGNPEATAACFHDGWFRTGDVAERDDRAGGYYRIVGRRSTDIIKSGGFKIGAREIEDVIGAIAGEVAVVGLPDERWGEIVAAAVVASPELEVELRAHCERELADFKRPRRWLFVEALPRNALGKVMKPAVKALFAEPEGRRAEQHPARADAGRVAGQ